MFGLHQGDERPTAKSRTRSCAKRCELEPPRDRRRRLRLKRQGAARRRQDRRALPEEVPRRAVVHAQPATSATYDVHRSAPTVETPDPRARRRPGQGDIAAASTSSACARPRVSTRDEDIIVEVPGRGREELQRRSATSSARRRASSSSCSTTRPTSSGRSREDASPDEPARRPRVLAARTRRSARTQSGDVQTQADHLRVPEARAETRRSKQALRALQGVGRDARASRPIARSATSSSTTVDPVTHEGDRGRLAHLSTSKRAPRSPATWSATPRPQPDQGQSALGGWHVALTFTDAGGEIFERDHRRQHQAPLRDHPRRPDRERARSSRRRSPAATRQITLGSGDPESSCATRASSSWCCAPARCPRRSRPPTSSASARRSARTRSSSGRAGRARRHRARAGLHGRLLPAAPASIADIAVLFNLFLQLAILASFGASMTLPGIAGLALTIGMSVDANVLINERIREELRAGKSPRAAVELGYDKRLQRDHRRPRHDVDRRPHARAVRHRARSRASPSR